MTYLPDPENPSEIWDEPILADGLQRAREKCQKLANTFVEQSRANVELIDVLPASQKTRKRYICRFRSEVEP